ncbi:hypothetical protein AGMMS50239_19910 [Bacteroidia bacterium]|nr:hypothetical protein AGMMS50239_19910 [Bacteroidia bacterium]
MAAKLHKTQTDTVSSVNEPVVAYQRNRSKAIVTKEQIISDLYAGIQALKAEQRGEYVKFGSLDDLIAELEN